jgi:hypothetical protein
MRLCVPMLNIRCTKMKRVRIFFPQDHSTFISKPLEKDDFDEMVHWVLEGGHQWLENDNGDKLLLVKSLLDRVTVTLEDEL